MKDDGTVPRFIPELSGRSGRVERRLMAEGWTWLRNSRKWHYFVDQRSLCGRFLLLANPDLEQGNDDSPDNCKACIKALASKRKEENDGCLDADRGGKG